MKKLQIFEYQNTICIKEYVDLNSKISSRIFKNKHAYDYLNYITRYLIKNIYQNDEEIQIEYDDFLICCKKDILTNFYVSPLLNQINRFINKSTGSNYKGEKVTRKNKHINKKVIASGLILPILLGSVYLSKKDKKVSSETFSTTSIVVEDETINDSINNSDFYAAAQEIQENEDDQTEKNVEIEENVEKESNNTMEINYPEFRPDYEKLEFVKQNYGQLIDYYSKMYGLNTDIMIAIATQERGVHSEHMDEGGATGLMQIQNSAWVGEYLKVYNNKLDREEEIVVSSDMLTGLEDNIKLGCMIFASYLKHLNNNVLAAIQCYNMGYGSMITILNCYGYECNKSRDEILNNPEDIGWLKYRNVVGIGDSHYLERILAYVGDTVHIESVGADLTIETTAKVR